MPNILLVVTSSKLNICLVCILYYIHITSKMPGKCFVPNCRSNSSKYDAYVTVFRFPTNDKIKSYREKAVGNDFKAKSSSKVCIKQSEDKYICGTSTSSRILLERNAIPKLFMPKLIFEEPYITYEYISINYKQFIDNKDIRCTSILTMISYVSTKFWFGRYRWLSGSNYYITVRDVINSEAKLKKLHSIKLKHARGITKINKVEDSEQCNQLEVNELYSRRFEISNRCFEIKVTQEEISLMTYISGYIIFKILPKLSRAGCINLLTTDKELILPEQSEIYIYIDKTSRGKLKYPTIDFAVLCATFLLSLK